MSVFSIFRNKKFDKFINDIDKTVDKINIPKTISSSNNLVSQTINQAIDNNDGKIDELFKSISGNQERVNMYSTYDELYTGLKLIKRIVIVYLNNLLQSDPISNQYITISNDEESDDNSSYVEYQSFFKEVLTFFNLEDRFKNKTAFNVIKYGDAFIETIDLEKVNIDFPKNKKQKQQFTNKYKFKLVTEREFLKKLSSKNKYLGISELDYSEIIENYVQFEDESLISESLLHEQEEESSKYNFSNVLLKFHKPHNIIPIYTDFDNILGYVELSESNTIKSSGNSTNNLLNFANLINQVSQNSSGNNVNNEEAILSTFADTVVLKVLNKHDIFYKNDTTYIKEIQSKLKKDVFNSLKRLLVSSKENSLFQSNLVVRFIKAENMFHFKNPNGENYPFGSSVIDPLIFTGKLLLLAQLANAVSKLSRASTLRKWTIETGAREDVTGLIQKLKRDLRNKRVTAQDIASSTNLPNILSDFKDVIAFKKKGQTMLDIENVRMNEPSIDTNDIEDLRRELIAVSGIPSSYLGYQDVTDLRDQLVHANISFSNDIINIQKNFNDELTKLFFRIAEISSFKFDEKFKKSIKVSLRPPTVLMLQLLEQSLNSISSIQRVFNEIPEIESSPMYLIKRMCPYINWKEFEKEAQDFKLYKKTLGKLGAGDDAGGAGGGGW